MAQATFPLPIRQGFPIPEGARRNPSAGTGVSLIAAAAGALGVPAAFWVIALIVGIILTLVALFSRVPTPPTQQQTPQAKNLDLPTRRHFIAASPSELIRPYRDYVAEEATRLTRPFIGSWIRIEGVVPDASTFGWRLGHDVALGLRKHSTPRVYLRLIPTDPLKKKQWRPGERLTAIGRIEAIGPWEVVLADCESTD